MAVKNKMEDIFTARDVARMYNISVTRVGQIARSRNIGRLVGNIRLFTLLDIREMKPMPSGIKYHKGDGEK